MTKPNHFNLGICPDIPVHFPCHTILTSHPLKDIEWGATMKEQEDIHFQEEIKKVITRFRKMFTFMLILIGGMIYCAVAAPPFWRITTFTAIWPLVTIVFSHFMLPIVLNPGLIKFKW